MLANLVTCQYHQYLPPVSPRRTMVIFDGVSVGTADVEEIERALRVVVGIGSDSETAFLPLPLPLASGAAAAAGFLPAAGAAGAGASVF